MATSDYKGKLEADVEIKASRSFTICGQTNRIMCTRLAMTRFKDVNYLKVNGGESVAFTCGVKFMAKMAKEVIEAIDSDKNSITFTVIEGDLMEEYKSFAVTIQSSAKSEGSGSIVHWTFEYERLHDAISHPETPLEFEKDLSKAIDAYLLAQ